MIVYLLILFSAVLLVAVVVLIFLGLRLPTVPRQEWPRRNRRKARRWLANGGLVPSCPQFLVGERTNEEMDYRRTKDAK